VNHKKISCHALTCIDPFTSCFEIIPIYAKEAPFIQDQLEDNQDHPEFFGQGNEFDNAWMYALCAQWYIKREPITVKNPRANAIVKILHKVMGGLLRCQLAKRHDKDDAVADLLSAASYGIQSTIHGTTQYTPGHLVLSKDMILRTHMEADMDMVRLRRQKAAIVNNERENKRCYKHKYKPSDKVLIVTQERLDPRLKFNVGPYTF
jgi:hypothetical protein